MKGTPMIVKFLRRTQRNEIYAKKRALKGKEMVITESLTRRRLQLLEAAREAFGWKSVWSMMGDIYVFTGEKKRQIKNFNDIIKLKQPSPSYAQATRS